MNAEIDDDAGVVDRRSFVTKVAVVGAATWTAPVVLSTAAEAGTSAITPPTVCVPVPHLLQWNDVVQGAFTSTTVDGITFAAAWTPLPSPPFNPPSGAINQAVAAPQQGGTGTRFLSYVMTPENTGGGQAIRFTFGATVRNVVFTLLDIDNQTNPLGDGTFFGWSDRVEVQTAPFSFTPGAGAVFAGDGTPGNPFANTLPTGASAGSTLGNMRLTFPGPLTTIDFTYFNGPINGGGNQVIGVSNISFDTCAP